jgi:hypothetical protein
MLKTWNSEFIRFKAIIPPDAVNGQCADGTYGNAMMTADTYIRCILDNFRIFTGGSALNKVAGTNIGTLTAADTQIPFYGYGTHQIDFTGSVIVIIDGRTAGIFLPAQSTRILLKNKKDKRGRLPSGSKIFRSSDGHSGKTFTIHVSKGIGWK